MADQPDDEDPTIISTEDARGGEVLKRGNFGDTLVPVLIGAVVLSVIGMGIAAFLSMQGTA